MGSKIAGITILVFGFFSFIFIYQTFISGTGFIGYIYNSILFIFLGILGVSVNLLIARGRKKSILLPSSEELINISDPIVYLRSFKDDSISSGFSGVSIKAINTYRPKAFVTGEEKLIKKLSSMGRVVAIGKPREQLPELGAERVYVRDDEWQRVVAGWMDRARLVVLRIGGTEGLWWEVQEAIRRVKPERLLFLVPGDKNLYEAFRAGMRDRGLPQLPDFAGTFDPAYALGGLCALIYFTPDWTGRFVPFKDEKSLQAALQPLV
jgi:hypothetical protein